MQTFVAQRPANNGYESWQKETGGEIVDLLIMNNRMTEKNKTNFRAPILPDSGKQHAGHRNRPFLMTMAP